LASRSVPPDRVGQGYYPWQHGGTVSIMAILDGKDDRMRSKRDRSPDRLAGRKAVIAHARPRRIADMPDVDREDRAGFRERAAVTETDAPAPSR
jgi:hypothetical protein